MYQLGQKVVYQCPRCPCEGPPLFSVELGEVVGIIDNRDWSDSTIYKIETNNVMRIINAHEVIMAA